MSPEQIQINRLETQVKELQDFMRSFENKAQLAPNIQKTIVEVTGGTTLNNLSDVLISSPTTNQVLKYNGSLWINDTDAT